MANKVMLRVGGGSPEEPGFPLYKPKDVSVIQLEDKRRINPATGTPYKSMGSKGIKANEEDVRAIIAHAKAKGVDPRTALAIALQETNIGQLDPNYGSAWATMEDEGFTDDRNRYANILAKAIKDKSAYARELRGKGLLPAGEEFDLQTYNGLGVLKPTLSVGGQLQNASYYGIPVTASHPLNLKKNPAYGKIVRQLRDEVIGTNPKIQELINSVPAYGQTNEAPTKKVMLQVRK